MTEAFNIDCINAMAQMKDNEFDLAIVDPPYGIGDTWSKNRSDRFYKKGKMHKYDNTSIPSEEYFLGISRVSKNQIIWGGNYYTEFLRPTNAWIIWDKERNAEITQMICTNENQAPNTANHSIIDPDNSFYLACYVIDARCNERNFYLWIGLLCLVYQFISYLIIAFDQANEIEDEK